MTRETKNGCAPLAVRNAATGPLCVRCLPYVSDVSLMCQMSPLCVRCLPYVSDIGLMCQTSASCVRHRPDV
eukprot:810338-Rhodomonas_salina.2